jgi:hypothetical protein|tara:strand:- start:1090 stop:1500 length:411 start_codon:yes stop_codon:yes gene_type:complete
MMIEDLNSLVKEYADLRKKYQDAYAESSELKHRCDTKKFELIEILNNLNLPNYTVEGIGRISVVNKYSVRVPKDPENKRKMLDYFKQKGEESDMLLTVHSQTLRSLYNEEKENDPHFSIPGVGEPVLDQNLSFTKK